MGPNGGKSRVTEARISQFEILKLGNLTASQLLEQLRFDYIDSLYPGQPEVSQLVVIDLRYYHSHQLVEDLLRAEEPIDIDCPDGVSP